MRFPVPAKWPLLSAAMLTPAVLIVVGALAYGGRALESIDHSFFDWRTALLGDQREGPHPDIAVVLIGEPSVEDKACRSPMDRMMLAQLIRRLDGLGARAIALDFFFDQPTLPGADAALETAIAEIGEKTPIVLAAYDRRFTATDLQHERQRKMLEGFKALPGYVNILRDSDGAVRRAAPPVADTPFPYSFPQQVARVQGIEDPSQPQRIAWLIPPERGDTFNRIEASAILSAGNAEIVRPLIENRVVLVGANLSDQRDSYYTPLSTVAADSFDRMPGVLINAHMVAQLMDGRNHIALSTETGMALAVFAAFFGVLYGWYFRHWRGPVNLPPLILFFIADVIAFSAFRVIIPFIIPAVAWILGAWLGKWIITKEVADADA